ncbi:uncharacterized protein [Drosophila takahashii]|uniref:uncharacterized protein n=1 Tax=Drosophila takahashii TaxID=29030 RepID=UPI001CF84CD7|nr:serine/arginine repetitive matrix protein 4 [Drosophila takahashii]
MSKRVSIMLPEEMPATPSGSSKNPMMTNRTVRSSIKNSSSKRTELVPPVFVVVSPQTSQSSMTSGMRESTSTNSRSSLSQSFKENLEEGSPEETSPLAQSGSNNSQESTTASIRQFLRSTVALVRAGESFTSVKRLFQKFIKNSASISQSKPSEVSPDSSASQVASGENPYLSKSNDTLITDSPAQFTVPSTSQMTPTALRSNQSLNNANYDLTSLLSDITPLTGYSTRTEAGYRTDTSEPPSGIPPSRSRSKSRSRTALKFKASSGPISRTRSSSRSSPRKKLSSPRRSPRLSPRNIKNAPLEPAFALVSSSSARNSEGSRLSRSSQGSSSKVTARNLTQSKKSSPRPSTSRSSRRGSRSRSRSQSSAKSELPPDPFALLSPEEAEPNSQPGGSNVEDGSTSCRTYEEECKCHHCQDMRRAVKRVEFFQSPEGQKRLEAKLLAKNFFMDLCALSAVRGQIKADLHGKRRHPSARLSYPVSICGATRLDGGSLSLKWFTHDLDSVDHFEIFVDNKPSRSVYNRQATSTVLVDVDATSTHKLRLKAVPQRGSAGRDSSVDRFMSEVAAGHMRHVRQGELFARCLEHLDSLPQQRTLVDFWRDSEFLYLPTQTRC